MKIKPSLYHAVAVTTIPYTRFVMMMVIAVQVRNRFFLISYNCCHLFSIPNDIEVAIVDVMRLVRIIPKSNISPQTFLSWTQQLIKYLENLPGNELHIIFDKYSIDTQLIHLLRNRAEKVSERNIKV